jgi:ribosomal protein L29
MKSSAIEEPEDQQYFDDSLNDEFDVPESQAPEGETQSAGAALDAEISGAEIPAENAPQAQAPPQQQMPAEVVLPVIDAENRERRIVCSPNKLFIDEPGKGPREISVQELVDNYKKPDGSPLNLDEINEVRQMLEAGEDPQAQAQEQMQQQPPANRNALESLINMISSPFRAALGGAAGLFRGPQGLSEEQIRQNGEARAAIKNQIERYNHNAICQCKERLDAAQQNLHDKMAGFDDLEIAKRFDGADADDALKKDYFKTVAKEIYDKPEEDLSSEELEYKQYVAEMGEALEDYNQAVEDNAKALEAAGKSPEQLDEKVEEFNQELENWEHQDKVIDEDQQSLGERIKKTIERIVNMFKRMFGGRDPEEDQEQQQADGPNPSLM